MLSESEQRSIDAAIRAMVARAEQNISAARSRSLNAQQRELVRQAEVFLAQARELRERDLHAARSLAERAELLSSEALK
jgi:1,6-anhydro-N-acetylmuramate kinase